MPNRRDALKKLTLGTVLGAMPAASHAQTSTTSKKIRGVVFIVSDGMSPGVLTLAQAFSRQTRNTDTAWWQLLHDPKSTHGLMDTASANSLVTDSAAASSAWGGGQRVNNGMINVAPNGKALEPIAHTLAPRGVRTGLVSTATITHATPAGFAAQVNRRDDEESIAAQYLDHVDILLGGGAKFFEANSRRDKQNLLEKYRTAGYSICRDSKSLNAASSNKILGLFASGHLPFSIDRAVSKDLTNQVPTLAEMSAKALQTLLATEKPFLLQIEGARVDHAAHFNDIAGLLHDQLALDDALAKVLAITQGRDDILIVVTSDHGNSNPGLNGMGASYQRSNQCFANIARFNASYEKMQDHLRTAKPEEITTYLRQRTGIMLENEEAKAFAEALAGHQIDEWNDLLAKPEGLLGQMLGNHTGIGWTGTVHTSDPTIITALGAQASRFHGMIKNTDIHGHLLEIF